MAYKIKELIFREGDYGNYQIIPDKNKRLSNLSKINVFIGENNSGKSRFLRELFKNKFDFIPYVDDTLFLTNLYQKYRDKFEQKIREIGYHTSQFPNIMASFNNVNSLISQKQYTKLYENIYELANTIQNFNGGLLNNTVIQPQTITPIGVDFRNDLLKKYPKQYNFEEVYIPVLRGLRPLQQFDVYNSRTYTDYFKEDKNIPNPNVSPQNPSSKSIFTGFTLYEELKNFILGSSAQQQVIQEFEDFLSKNFFNKSIKLTPQVGKDVVVVKIGEEEKEIYHLGDGIQQIIILTFQMFMKKDENIFFFIEEPELYLHPGMQRIFLDTITTHEGFENFQYFIATHSNHFLDITLDTDQISVYTFKKTKEVDEKGHPFFDVENVTNDDARTLELIGVRNSSVFLSNCTIWVEGITDRMYLRKYLELYQKTQDKQFKEDLHYSFVEYGGGNITHWSFLGEQDNQDIPTIDYKKITNKIFLVSDKDTGKEERHEELRNHLGDAKINKQGKYYCLDCREIENLLMPHVLQKVIGRYEKNKGNTSDIPLFNYDEYKNEYLGSFIDDKLTNKKVKSYKDGSSGTIKDKPKFAKRAIDSLQDYSDLSEEAQKLTEKIYNFIASHNNG